MFDNPHLTPESGHRDERDEPKLTGSFERRMRGGHSDLIKTCRTGSESVQQAEGFVSEIDKDVMERD
jgi:hypothetical protein